MQDGRLWRTGTEPPRRRLHYSVLYDQAYDTPTPACVAEKECLMGITDLNIRASIARTFPAVVDARSLQCVTSALEVLPYHIDWKAGRWCLTGST